MTLMCIDRSQSPAHKGNFLQGGKSTVSNINQQNANHHRRNSCSPPLSKIPNCNSHNDTSPAKSPNNSDGRKLERSSSEPASDRRVVQSNSSRYKTELCRPYEENGICKYGDKCQFAHGMKELRSMARHPKYKTELCRTFHSTGLCPYGPRCHFIHNSEQTKKFLLNNLTGSPNPTTRPKALTSLGSAGDISPTSSDSSTPTGTKSFFDDMYQQQSPLSPSSVFYHPDSNMINNLQGDYPLYDYNSDSYELNNVFNEKLISGYNLDNFNFQSGPVLNLCPSGPLDSNHLTLRLPFFEGVKI